MLQVNDSTGKPGQLIITATGVWGFLRYEQADGLPEDMFQVEEVASNLEPTGRIIQDNLDGAVRKGFVNSTPRLPVLRTDKIRCPACSIEQMAEVGDDVPWPVFVHECIRCKYIILESEWDIVKRGRHVA